MRSEESGSTGDKDELALVILHEDDLLIGPRLTRSRGTNLYRSNVRAWHWFNAGFRIYSRLSGSYFHRETAFLLSTPQCLKQIPLHGRGPVGSRMFRQDPLPRFPAHTVTLGFIATREHGEDIIGLIGENDLPAGFQE